MDEVLEGVRLGVTERRAELPREGLMPREEPRDEVEGRTLPRLLEREGVEAREEPRELERPKDEPRELEARPAELRPLERDEPRWMPELREEERCGLKERELLRLGLTARERDEVALERPAELRPRWAKASASIRRSRLNTARTASRIRERFIVSDP